MEGPITSLEQIRNLLGWYPRPVVLDGNRDGVGRPVVVLHVHEHASTESSRLITPTDVAKSISGKRRYAPRDLLSVDRYRRNGAKRNHPELDTLGRRELGQGSQACA